MGHASIWLATIRPRTLPAGAVPVLVGAAYANDIGSFAPLPALAALAGALLLQIGSNLANDYYDHIKGADTPDRAGPVRASASGLLPPRTVRNAAYYTFLAAALVGVYLIIVGGLPILLIGTAAIAAGLLYTAGPKPLGYMGLGDALVFLFFGPVAVAGTVYVQSGTWEPGAFAWGAAVGALAAAILAVNNLRDIPTDAAAGKRTLAVRIGERGTRIQYTLLLIVAFTIPTAWVAVTQEWLLLLPLLALVPAIDVARRVWRDASDRSHLNGALAQTAAIMLLYGLLAAVGLAL